MHLKFQSISRPVLLAQGLKLLPHLTRVFANWPFREVPAGRFGDPAINVLQDGEAGIIQAPWIDPEQRYDNAADLADSLGRHMARCWIRDNAPVLGLAAGAVRFGGDLAVLVGGPRSGKSLLLSCLSVSGHTVFADAVLPISADTGECLSLGMAPRLRLPLPDALSSPLRDRVESGLDSGAPHLGYLTAAKAEIAAFGDRASPRAFIALDRADGGPASLRPATASALLKRLLLGSADSLPSRGAALALLHELVGDAPCYRLTWSDPSEAVSALRARLAIWPDAEDGLHLALRSASPPQRRVSGPRRPAGRLYRHVEGLDERLVDGTMFLVIPDGEAIYHLNGLGTGLWRLLDGSHGLDDVIAVLQDAFPTVDRTLIEGDVLRLIADLVERGLLVEQPTGVPAAKTMATIP